jgi:predicted MPP superfamily phosphohydrolase
MKRSERKVEPLFTWVHLSDIHIGHGDDSYRWNQQLVLEKLKDDIANPSAEYDIPIPDPDVIFVTGDLAFSGATRSTEEYTGVRNWLLAIATSLSISKTQIFIVPGNHDVQRNVAKKDNNIARLLNSLRSGREKLDKALADERDQVLLAQRMENYFNFAKEFAPSSDSELFWKQEFTMRGLKIRIAGLNTAFLSADDRDKEKLELGERQLTKALLPFPEKSKEVVIALSHHPFNWLRDGRNASEWMRNNAHIHLCGHIHEASSERFRSGGGTDFTQIVSGAAHGERNPKNIPTGHGYNFGAILVRDDGQLFVRVWPRIWFQANTDFRIDAGNIPKGRDFAEHEMPLKLPSRPTQKPPDDLQQNKEKITGSQESPTVVSGKPKGKMVMLYANKNYKFLQKSSLTNFLESLAIEEDLEFSWDRKSLGEAEMKKRLAEADIVVCLVSEPFITSTYFKEAQSKIETGRQKKQQLIIVPILLDESSWKKYKWLETNDPLPGDGYIIPDHNSNRSETFKNINESIRMRLRDRRHAVTSTAPVEAVHKPRALYTLRRLPDSSFTEEEMNNLVEDSRRRAQGFVPASKLREKICRTAQKWIKQNDGQPLGKDKLEELDDMFLLPLENRTNKDAKKIRWVLRANHLHPQGKIVR